LIQLDGALDKYSAVICLSLEMLICQTRDARFVCGTIEQMDVKAMSGSLMLSTSAASTGAWRSRNKKDYNLR
jgi:hypothetical protein